MRAAILLAAGQGSRFGRQDKLLALLNGKPVLLHALDRARESGAARLVVVVDPCRPRRLRLLHGAGVTIVRARNAREGMGASLAAGLEALRPIEREVLIFLADMPFASAPRRMRLDGADAARPIHEGRPGHPVLVRAAAARAGASSGDRGLTGLRFATVRGAASGVRDIDTRAGWRSVRGRQIRRC